ncbi:MAG: VCBS repeat-containing protein [Candidatus Heimdallarchaeota archaeon]|nr:VCBS repeat-containing protein [Candidatus Heimdallarchaeota archaeon]
MTAGKLSFKKYQIKSSLILAVICISTIFTVLIYTSPSNFGDAHSKNAEPLELFSLWNNTAPVIDGLINFNLTNIAAEWSGAAVYSLYDDIQTATSKLLIQNNNSYLFLGLDMTDYLVQTPANPWGMALYFDLDHNGILTTGDRQILFVDNTSLSGNTGQFVLLKGYSESSRQWNELENGVLGTPLTNSKILVNSGFGSSYFNSANHRQYEIRIPLSVLSKSPGEILGFACEGFDNFLSLSATITWPFVSSSPSEIREEANKWGDLYLGEETAYTQYVIEENTNIKDGVLGWNNATFLALGDIDGNGDQELIIGSNSTVTGSENLLAIYDYVSNEFTRIWASWTTAHQSKMIKPLGIATYDFDGNGEDEIYIVSNKHRILRFTDWNATTHDFDTSEYVFTAGRNLMGFISIGDVLNLYNEPQIVVSAHRTTLLDACIFIIKYDSGSDSFSLQDTLTANSLPNIFGSKASGYHAVQVGDMDNDDKLELLTAAQYDNRDNLSLVGVQIFQNSGFGSTFEDNQQDDLSGGSSTTTKDQFIHTILVGDVDNDGINESVFVGRNYLRVFGKNTFSNANPPIEILINNTIKPIMGGGAAIGDIDSDGANELIFGASNGTLYIVNVTDTGSDNLSYTIEWSGDIGDTVGKRGAIQLVDLDKDGETELFVGDTYGQIISLGKSASPVVIITSPSDGSVKKDPNVFVQWSAVDSYTLHHFDIYINGTFYARTGGAQRGILLPLLEGQNTILVNGTGITGKFDTDSITVTINLASPEVTILQPSNNYVTNKDTVTLLLTYSDKNGDFDHYDIYINSSSPVYTTSTNSQVIDFVALGLGEGIFNITVVAVDLALNTGRDTIFIIRDLTNPTITITTPLDGAAVKLAAVQVQWSGSDVLSGIDYYQIFLNGVLNGTTSSSSFTITLGIDAQYTIAVWAFDRAGNSNAATITITKDSIAPTIEITSHLDYAVIETTNILLEWTVADNFDGTGIDHTEIMVNGAPAYSGLDTSAVIDLVDDGYKVVSATAFDLAGNSKEDVITLIVDRVGPYVNILKPVNNYNTSFDYINLNWESYDAGAGLREYQIYVDGTLQTTITNEDQTYATIALPTVKSYTISVRALDMLNHTTSDTIFVNRVASLAQLIITFPVSDHYFSSTTDVAVSWDWNDLTNLQGFVIYINGTINYTINDNTTTNQLVNFGPIPLDEYPLYNLTVMAITTGVNYSAMCWITIDQQGPIISISNPANNSMIYDSTIHLVWTGVDPGSGVKRFTIFVDGIAFYNWSSSQTEQYLFINTTASMVTITIQAEDFATNIAREKVVLQLYLLLPTFSVNLSNPYYTNTGSFGVELTISEPQIGVQGITIFIDGAKIYTYDYSASIQTQPFALEFAILASTHYTASEGSHTLIIVVEDSQKRETLLEQTIIIDAQTPNVLGILINDQSLSNGGGGEPVKIEFEPGTTNFTITITVNDNVGLQTVSIRIMNSEINQSFLLTPTNTSTPTLGVYSITFSIVQIPLADYTIQVIVSDLAGNTLIHNYQVSLTEKTIIPWILQGNNLIYIAAGVALFIILIIVLSVAIRKRVMNLGWKNEIITIAYILNGLPCVYMMNKPELVKGDLLFGGAMTGIRGVLEEITGEKSKMKIQSVDIGDKKVLICPGNYGDSVLMVNKIKPIHKQKILEFTKAFEQDYGEILQQEDLLITPNTFPGANILVQVHFGISDTAELIDESEYEEVELSSEFAEYSTQQEYQPPTQEYTTTTEESYQQPLVKEEPPQQPIEMAEETTPAIQEETLPKERIQVDSIEQLIAKLEPEMQQVFIQLIQETQQALSAILERDFDMTRELNAKLLEKLEVLLTSENLPEQINPVIQSLFTISKELVNAIESGTQGDNETFRIAAEKASTIWIREISEKW